MGLTLSGQEIRDLAEYCGFQIVPESIEQDFLEGDFYIEKCPAGGVAGDDGVAKMYGHVVTCDGCDGGECMPLGEATGKGECQFNVGDVVAPVSQEHVLASGCQRYGHAVVVSVNPFVLVSEKADMRWSCTVKTEYFKKIGTAHSEIVQGCMNRLVA
jgi:hypothetical protein